LGDDVRGKGRKRTDDKWLKALGDHIAEVIQERGYKSVYDFWVQKAGDDIARASLNYLIAGKGDPKASTLRTLARLLGVKPSKLLDFE
jgi:hypothetical protein